MILKSSLSIVNQYRHVIRRVNSVVAYCIRTHGVIGSSPGQNTKVFLFSENPNHTFAWPYCKWPQCWSHLKSLFVRHVGVTDCRKLKRTIVGGPQWRNAHTKFRPNPSNGSRVESCRQTDRHVHFTHIMQQTHKESNLFCCLCIFISLAICINGQDVIQSANWHGTRTKGFPNTSQLHYW
jgi:hypothetical protein